MIQRHKAGILKQDVRVELERETLARMIPLVLDAAEALVGSQNLQSSMSCLAHLFDKAPAAVLDAAFVGAEQGPDRAAQSPYCELGPCSTVLCSLLQKVVSHPPHHCRGLQNAMVSKMPTSDFFHAGRL